MGRKSSSLLRLHRCADLSLVVLHLHSGERSHQIPWYKGKKTPSWFVHLNRKVLSDGLGRFLYLFRYTSCVCWSGCVFVQSSVKDSSDVIPC